MFADLVQSQRVAERNFVDKLARRRQRKGVRFEAAAEDYGTSSHEIKKTKDSLAVNSGIVQNRAESGDQSLADAASTQTIVVQRNDELFGQKLSSLISVEPVCV